ncbi:MAG: TIGR02757 family protein [Deltaproteobacteria bacterium]|nr:TIGR02757 family protein [Deltaproteobacteria bacterium]
MPRNIKNLEKPQLKRLLDLLYRTFDLKFLSPDPLEFVHGFSSTGDREVVGLISASLAYGRVEGIRRSIGKALGVMGSSPFRFVMDFRPKRDSSLFSGFVHRFNRGPDMACLVYFIRQMVEESGSVGGFFLKGYSPEERNVKGALDSFSRRALSLDSSPVYGGRELPKGAGVRFFFPAASDGSPCKRLNLYLWWMVRRGDDLDFGIWKEVDPAKLVIPLDTHIARISRNIGLTRRSTPDWKMAEEITDSLSEFDPKDPVKYDFALCRLGILDKCPKRMDPARCASCMLKKVCIL